MPALQPGGGALTPVDVTQQYVILARLGDFCRFNTAVSSRESDPWGYMRGKLRELETPIRELKQSQLEAAAGRFLDKLKAAIPGEEALSDFKLLLDRYLAPGDFVDIAFNLDPAELARPDRRQAVSALLRSARARCLFDEERRPAESRGRAYEKLISELYARLGLDVCEQALERKPRTPRRKAMVLRRIRRNVAEYCAVLHIPTSAEDTFSPFMLPRVEALVIACLRLLDRFR